MTAQFTAKPRLPSGPSSRFESYTPAFVFGLIMTGAWLVAGWSLFGYYGGPTAFSRKVRIHPYIYITGTQSGRGSYGTSRYLFIV